MQLGIAHASPASSASVAARILESVELLSGHPEIVRPGRV